MKKIKLFMMAILLSSLTLAQTFPVGSPPTPFVLPNQAQSAWYRGGNFPIGATPLTCNVFGTMWNAAIHTKTDSQLRTKLNGTFNIPGAPQYPINGYTAATGVNTSGYLLIGNNTPTQLGGLIYDTKGAFSMLHLNGAQNVFTQEFGYRPWMKTGVTFTDNTDLLYMGVRSLPTIAEQSEMVVSWSDNTGSPYGPDDFAFRFIGVGASNVVNTNLSDENDFDGRHIARFTPFLNFD